VVNTFFTRSRGYLTPAGIVLAAMVVALALAASPTRADIGAAGFDDGDPMFVPLRWCALKGSPAVTNPAGVGEADTDGVLWRRHERASDFTWIPGAGISFRSAMAGTVTTNADFPIIDDPFPPNPATPGPGGSATDGPGVLGDILDYSIDDPRGPAPGQTSAKFRELGEALADCDAKWNALETQLGTNLEGPVALNVNKHVDLSGTETYVGLSSFAFNGAVGTYQTICTALQAGNPSLMGSNTGDAFIAVRDNNADGNFDPATKDILTAHEAGHALFLAHGNGLDDDGDNHFDGCDGSWVPGQVSPPDETSNDPRGLMHPAGGEGLTPLQRKVARAVARITVGSTFDPPGELDPVPVVADHRVDSVREKLRAPANNLESAGIARDSAHRTTMLTHKVVGAFDAKSRADYAMFVDLDNDPKTGGSPRELGLDTDFKGADLVSVVAVRGNKRQPRARVSVFKDGRFELVKKAVRASFGLTRTTPDFRIERPVVIDPFGTLTVTIPNKVVPVRVPPEIRFEATADATDAGGGIDRLPDTGRKRDGVLRITPPDYPVCDGGKAVDRGGRATIAVRGMPDDADIHVLLGPVEVGKARVRTDGRAKFSFRLKRSDRPGPRLITVGVLDKALTADCFLTVKGKVPREAVIPAKGAADEGGKEDGGGFPWWVAIVVGAVALLALTLTLRRRRR
jgi:hypothetical protein